MVWRPIGRFWGRAVSDAEAIARAMEMLRMAGGVISPRGCRVVFRMAARRGRMKSGEIRVVFDPKGNCVAVRRRMIDPIAALRRAAEERIPSDWAALERLG